MTELSPAGPPRPEGSARDPAAGRAVAGLWASGPVRRGWLVRQSSWSA